MLVTLVRVGGPLLNQHRERVISALLGDSQIKVSVDQLGLSWSKFGPAIKLQQLTIAPDSGRFDIRLGNAWVQLDFWRTLNQLKPVFGELILSDGDIALDFSQPIDPHNKRSNSQQEALLRFLLTQIDTFNINNTRINITTTLGDMRVLDIAQLRWQNRDKRHQGVGKAYLVNGVGESTLDLIVDVDAPQSRFDRLKGRLYLDANQLDISPILARIHAGEPKVNGVLDFQLWSDFEGGKLGDTLLAFGNNYLIWQEPDKQDLHRFSLDGGKIQLRRTGDDWQLASHDVTFELDDKPWLQSRLQLERVGERVQGYLPRIDFDKLAQLGQLVSTLYPSLSETLRQTKPQGSLQDLILLADADWKDLSLNGRLVNLSLKAWQDVPGIKNLNGEFWLTPTAGSARLELAKDRLDPARHFKALIPIDHFSARLDWWQEAQGWVFYGRDIALDNPDLTIASRFRLELFEHPFLALTGRVDVKNAGHADRYFPLQVMDKGLVNYLSGAIKGGRAKGADLLWYGEFRDFPYDKGNGIFQVAVPLEQATYEFFPGWQPLTSLQIDLLFQNASLDMRSRSTKLGKANSDSVHAWIPVLSPSSHLYVDARVQGEGEAISDYLQDSPLGNSVGQVLREIEIHGPMGGTVKLDIPLDGNTKVKASGDASFSNNKVRVVSLGLPLEQVRGRLEYDNEQTRFRNLKASLWNQPITLDYQGRQHADHYQADLNFKGQWDSQHQPLNISSYGVLNGRSSWSGKLGLTLPDDKPFSFQLALNSNLQGMALDLPAPLAKRNDDLLPLKVAARGQGGRADIRAELGDNVNIQSQLVYDEETSYLNRVRVDVGQQGYRVVRDAPMLFIINQQEADVAGWLARLKQWLPASANSGTAVVGPTFFPREWWVDGQLARAHIGSATIRATRFTVGPVKQAVEVMIDSPDVMGVVRVPMVENRPIDAKFARIHWSGKHSDFSQQLDTKQDNAIMAAIPWLQFSCTDCRFGTLPLGEVKGELIPSTNKLTLKSLDMQLADSQLSGSVDWLANDGRMTTRARGQLTSSNSELLLKRLGYISPIGDAPGSLTFDLNWQDVPYRPNVSTLAGSASYQLEGGTLREVDDKGARLFSLLSLDSLLRKLRLDFRDVFDKGLYFESMSASAMINQGQVKNDDFYMKGATGNLRGEGVADLVGWQLDYDMSFSPNLGGTLPVVAAFSITPVTGLYVLALSKLLEPVVDVVTRIDFQVSGPLDAPKLVEAGRDRARIKLNQQQKRAVDAVAPSLPAQEVTPFLLTPSNGGPTQR